MPMDRNYVERTVGVGGYDILDELSGLADSVRSANEQANADKLALDQAKELANQQRDATLNEVKRTLGFDPMNPASDWSKQAVQLKEAVNQVTTLAVERNKEINSRSDWENVAREVIPIYNIISSIHDENQDKKLASAVNTAKVLFDGMREVQETLQGAAVTTNAVKAAYSSEANATALNAIASASKASSAVQNFAVTGQRLESMERAARLANTESNTAVNRAQLEQIEADKMSRQAQERLISSALSVMGHLPTSANILKFMNSPQKLALLSMGMRIESGDPALASSPGEAYEILRQYSSPLLRRPGTIWELIGNVAQDMPAGTKDVASWINAHLAGGKNETGQDIKGALSELNLDHENNPFPGKSSRNILKAPSADTVMAHIVNKDAKFATQPWVISVLKPTMSGGAIGALGNPNFTLDEIIKRTIAAMRADGSTLTEQAAVEGITKYYSGATELNNMTTHLAYAGLRPQKEYYAHVSDGLFGRKRVNAVSPDDVRARLRILMHGDSARSALSVFRDARVAPNYPIFYPNRNTNQE